MWILLRKVVPIITFSLPTTSLHKIQKREEHIGYTIEKQSAKSRLVSTTVSTKTWNLKNKAIEGELIAWKRITNV